MKTNTYKTDESDVGQLNIVLIKRLFKYLKPYRKKAFYTVVLMLTATVMGLVSPYFMKIAIDKYIPSGNVKALFCISILLLLAHFISYICRRKKMSYANYIGQDVLFDIRKELFSNVQYLSFDYFDSNSAGKIIVRIVNDVNTLNNLFTNGFISIITEFSMIIFAAIMMTIIHPRLAQLTLIGMSIFILVIFFMKNKIKRLWSNVRKKISNLNGYIHESICGMKVIQAYVRQKKNRSIFKNVIGDVLNSWMKAVRLSAAFGPTVNLISVLSTIFIYWYGAKLLDIGGVTIGVLIAFTSYLKKFWRPVIRISDVYNQLLVAMASSERIFELMDQKSNIFDLPDAKELASIKGNVTFKNVTFAYEKEKTVLKNINFNVKCGETVAFVGSTGSGKTTIINLLARFYDPVKGKILIDGHDIKHVKLKSLRERIGIMMQEPFIFSGSVIDNIKYGKINANKDEVIKACKIVGAHDFIKNMENGYNTILNERGSRLSVGQRQLIAFARVLLANPDILILDEATASIDTHTEILLQNAINKVLKGRTSFVIAHRLSTIRNADRIMVIDNGEIVETGTHDELLNEKGIYYDLYHVQYKYLQAV